MAQDQGMTTFKTVGDLKQGLQALPDDTKLSLGQIGQAEPVGEQQEQAIGVEGISMVQDGDRVTFGAAQQGAETTTASQT
ncbi:hypothetical protein PAPPERLAPAPP_04190 [Brevundimonas phage vB_BpoS-Papperlapapp]|uniref:Uncharacterized protein n=2 Tax=Marchewkavirus TaxID=3425052 RepID=A0A9E7SJ82_9CAUD|nr:hypothetical protein KABACHOK_02570 [Brevundimonas phage vB_BpoS-Kabachok]USN14788.1 hypothetical protein DOMOVOI_03140 [Brevundimonas phage vB_BpoS-Domovoi]USN16160.1 hypothetical protein PAPPERLAPAPP_04190 [Brevundimonas phage vB_BpoS-Papperlapapp]